jgi:hypothetical protein
MFILQTLALIAVCAGLWMLCRRVRAAAPRRMFLITAGGFLFRAFAGCALFWISFLGLPIARSLQAGDGFWFFALDGTWYFQLATTYAAAGLKAIALVPGGMPSPFFIQILALFEYLFGPVASVGLLINAICYLVTAAVLVWLSKRDERVAKPATIALLIVSFAPGVALWALQPLKDPLFDCLLALFIAACVAWQDLWSGAARKRVLARTVALAAALFALSYAIAAIRWYTAFALWLTLPLFALFICMVAPRRVAAVCATLLLMFVCSRAILLGSAAYLPKQARTVLQPVRALAGDNGSLDFLRWLDVTRRGYDTSPAATAITAGPRVARGKSGAAVESPVPEDAGLAQASRMPASRGERIIAGAVAAFVPRALAQPLGLIVIEGGRGFWLIADADTIVLDALVIFVIVVCVRGVRARRTVAPAAVLVLASIIAIGAPMLYTVSNFGTLFRLRQILAVELCLLPLVMTLSQHVPKEGG